MMLRHARLCGLLVMALLAAAVAATPASAAFSAPFSLSAAGQDADFPQVAVDGDGDAVFTWVRSDGTNDRVQARTRSAAGALSAVQDLSAAGQDATDPQVAVDGDGDAEFTWVRSDGTNDRVQARTRSAAGALSAVQDLSAAGQNAFDAQVAVDGDGDAAFTWARSNGTNSRVQARTRSAAGALSAVQDLSAAGQNANFPQVAVDADGDATFTWQRSDGTNSRAQARTRSAAGALSAVQDLSAAGESANRSQVAVDDGGDAVFTWRRSDGTNLRAQARTRSAAGALSAVQDLSAAGQNATDPQVAVDDGGDAVFTWERSDGTNTRVQARTRSAAGALSAVQDLSAAGQSGLNPQVAVDADGDATFTWHRSDGTNSRAQARTRSAAGALSAVQDLSAAGESAADSQVAVDDGGDAVFTWRRSDGTDLRVQGAVTLPPPPPPPPPPLPPNDFSFGKAKKNKKNGTAKLTVEVPGAGELELATTKKVKGTDAQATGAGDVKLRVKAKGKAKKKLNSKGAAKVDVDVTFTPTGGEANTQSKPLKLVRR